MRSRGEIEKHTSLILEQFANGVSMAQIAENLIKIGVENGFRYDPVYDVRRVLRAHDQITQARKRRQQDRSISESSPVECPNCGKLICPHCGKPIS